MNNDTQGQSVTETEKSAKSADKPSTLNEISQDSLKVLGTVSILGSIFSIIKSIFKR